MNLLVQNSIYRLKCIVKKKKDTNAILDFQLTYYNLVVGNRNSKTVAQKESYIIY